MAAKGTDEKAALKKIGNKLEGISEQLEVLQKKVDQLSPSADADREMKEEARNSLLDHFSSKSTNQTTILLTLALVIFGLTEIYHAQLFFSKFMNNILFTLGLGIIGYLTVRAVGRLLYWGGLADGILRVDMWNEADVQKLLDFELPPEKDVKCYPTMSERLYFASSKYNRARKNYQKHTFASLWWRFTDSKWFARVSVIAISLAIVGLLTFSWCTGTW